LNVGLNFGLSFGLGFGLNFGFGLDLNLRVVFLGIGTSSYQACGCSFCNEGKGPVLVLKALFLSVILAFGLISKSLV
jgi:hypothetical protein